MQRGAEGRGVRDRLSSLSARFAGDRFNAGGSGVARFRHARLNPGRRAVVAMAVVAMVSLVVTGAWVLASRPHRLAAATPGLTSAPPSISPGGSLMSPLASPSAAGSGATAAHSEAAVVVDVVGKVRKPGVYRLAAGARVDDAVAAAGGALTGVDLVAVNLARKLSDGEQVAIGITVMRLRELVAEPLPVQVLVVVAGMAPGRRPRQLLARRWWI